MNGDGNPIVKARCAAVAVLSCCEKETFVTGLLYQAYEDLSNPTYLIPATSVLYHSTSYVVKKGGGGKIYALMI